MVKIGIKDLIKRCGDKENIVVEISEIDLYLFEKRYNNGIRKDKMKDMEHSKKVVTKFCNEAYKNKTIDSLLDLIENLSVYKNQLNCGEDDEVIKYTKRRLSKAYCKLNQERNAIKKARADKIRKYKNFYTLLEFIKTSCGGSVSYLIRDVKTYNIKDAYENLKRLYIDGYYENNKEANR